MKGLILAGGNSLRMGTDKALLPYHGTPQYLYLQALLRNFCNEVFVSSKKVYPEANMLLDNEKYNEIGPIGGLLTAFDYSDSDWLVVAVDYPYITQDDLTQLIHSKNKLAAVFYNPITNFYEPYIGLYKKEFREILLENYAQNVFSLQSILMKKDIEKIVPFHIESITNVNTPEGFELISSAKNG